MSLGKGTVQGAQEVRSALALGPSWAGAYLAEVVDGEHPAPSAAVCVLQAHKLTDWMVGVPETPSECPFQLVQVQGAMGHVREGLGMHPGDLQAGEGTGSYGWSGTSRQEVSSAVGATSGPQSLCSENTAS